MIHYHGFEGAGGGKAVGPFSLHAPAVPSTVEAVFLPGGHFIIAKGSTKVDDVPTIMPVRIKEDGVSYYRVVLRMDNGKVLVCLVDRAELVFYEPPCRVVAVFTPDIRSELMKQWGTDPGTAMPGNAMSWTLDP